MGSLPFGLIGRYGLPEVGDLEWIRSLTTGRDHIFLGDCDPPDLLIFAWLRCHLHGLRYVGVGELLLHKLAIPNLTSIEITLSDSEVRSLPLLRRACPDLTAIVGPKCAAMLDRGRKIEIEGAFQFATVAQDQFAELLSE
jgi:hypothetical protein